MLTYRRKTELFDYPIFNVDSMTSNIEWDDISDNYIIHTVKTFFKYFDEIKLYDKQKLIFTPIEMVSLCNLPLIDTSKSNSILTLEMSDIEQGFAISNLHAYPVYSVGNVNSTMPRTVLIRNITIDKPFELGKPGYRIETENYNQFQFVISVIHDKKFPNTESDLIRFCGELSELILQYELAQRCGIKVSYNAPSYTVYNNIIEGESVSLYHSTGMIVMNDFPSIKDVLFEYHYLESILIGISAGFAQVIEKSPSNDQLLEYFNIDYGDSNNWCLDKEEMEDYIKLDFVDKNQDIKYAIKKIHKLYFEDADES